MKILKTMKKTKKNGGDSMYKVKMELSEKEYRFLRAVLINSIIAIDINDDNMAQKILSRMKVKVKPDDKRKKVKK